MVLCCCGWSTIRPSPTAGSVARRSCPSSLPARRLGLLFLSLCLQPFCKKLCAQFLENGCSSSSRIEKTHLDGVARLSYRGPSLTRVQSRSGHVWAPWPRWFLRGDCRCRASPALIRPPRPPTQAPVSGSSQLRSIASHRQSTTQSTNRTKPNLQQVNSQTTASQQPVNSQ